MTSKSYNIAQNLAGVSFLKVGLYCWVCQKVLLLDQA